MKTYYHFCRSDRKLGYSDGRTIKVGETLIAKGKIELCENGMHASERLIDALSYAPGPVLCKVALGGEIIAGNDKVVAENRTVLAMADVSDILRKFARKCALDVIDLWDAPDIVERYLKTGDESIRVAAGAAAWDAAIAAARAATWAAAMNAARAADGAAAEAADGAAAREKQNRRLVAMIRKADWETVK